jgi:hypothetical protein
MAHILGAIGAGTYAHLASVLLDNVSERHSSSINIFDPKNEYRQKIFKLYGTLGTLRDRATEITNTINKKSQSYASPDLRDRVLEKIEAIHTVAGDIMSYMINPYDMGQATQTIIVRFIYYLSQLTDIAQCSSPLGKKCVESGYRTLKDEIKQLIALFGRVRKLDDADLTLLDRALDVDLVTDWVGEARRKYVYKLDVSGVGLGRLLLLYHTTITLDKIPSGWKRTYDGAGDHMVLFVNQTTGESQRKVPTRSTIEAYYDPPSSGQLIGGGGGVGTKKLTGYQLFVRETMPRVKADSSIAQNHRLATIASHWRRLSANEKANMSLRAKNI